MDSYSYWVLTTDLTAKLLYSNCQFQKYLWALRVSPSIKSYYFLSLQRLEHIYRIDVFCTKRTVFVLAISEKNWDFVFKLSSIVDGNKSP